MEAFPFTFEEWSCVSEAARAVVNATFAKDEVLHASRLEELECALSDLQDKYGQHPVLLETEADFTREASKRIVLYEKAKQLALAGGCPTYSIQLSLVRVLLEERDDAERDLQELLACRAEVTSDADKSELREWQELHEECVRRVR
jgi:hypothetical protein